MRPYLLSYHQQELLTAEGDAVDDAHRMLKQLPGLQPYVYLMYISLQPYVSQPATVRIPIYNLTYPSQQPYVSQACSTSSSGWPSP